MKKISTMLTMFLLLLLSYNAGAQVVNIPGSAKEHFLKTYKDAQEASWSNNVTSYTVKFKNNGATCRAHYRLDGTWDFTETLMKKEEIPAEVKTSYSKSRFSDWSVESVTMIDNDNKQHLYRVEAKKGSEKMYIFYDESGKEIKTSRKI